MIFFVIIGMIVVGNVFWWAWSDRRVRKLPGAPFWRTGVALLAGCQLAYICLNFYAPAYARRPHTWLPAGALGFFYVWNLIALPTLMVALLLHQIVSRTHASVRNHRRPTNIPFYAGDTIYPKDTRQMGVALDVAPAEHNAEARQEPRPPEMVISPAPKLTRRQWLGAAAAMVPPLIAGGATARGIAQLGELRVRSIEVKLANLPPELDGLTIAQVTDIHIGRFTRKPALDRIVEITNRLRADLVVITGDLIDVSLSDFPAGVDLINRLDPRHGLMMVEGNHDLIESPFEFESRCRAANMPILLDETRTLKINGTPIQFMGIRWGRLTDSGRRSSSNSVIRDSVSQILQQRDPGAFPILLAHHPHAFDSAAQAGIPLTLAGHTHGGQLMLTERLGAGPVMFKYWSGLYQQGNSALVVSNGAGNWFPLRVNAPAEIVHVTLRCGTA